MEKENGSDDKYVIDYDYAIRVWRHYIDDIVQNSKHLPAHLLRSLKYYDTAAKEITTEPIDPDVGKALLVFAYNKWYAPCKRVAKSDLLNRMDFSARCQWFEDEQKNKEYHLPVLREDAEAIGRNIAKLYRDANSSTHDAIRGIFIDYHIF